MTESREHDDAKTQKATGKPATSTSSTSEPDPQGGSTGLKNSQSNSEKIQKLLPAELSGRDQLANLWGCDPGLIKFADDPGEDSTPMIYIRNITGKPSS